MPTTTNGSELATRRGAASTKAPHESLPRPRPSGHHPPHRTLRAAAQATGIPQSRLSAILAGRRAITADTAARLGRYFGVDPRNWLNLQSAYDLWKLEQESGKKLNQQVKPRAAA